MSVTVKYVNGTAAIFSSKEEALAQALHDQGQPHHVNPAYVVDGDHSESHNQWPKARSPEKTYEHPGDMDPPEQLELLFSKDDLKDQQCDCVGCEFQREANKLGVDSAAEKSLLLEELKLKRILGPDFYAQWKEKDLKPIAGAGVPGAGFTITVTALALTAATAKTAIGVATGSNTPVDIVEFAAMGDALSGNLLIELVFGTNATNPPGTASSSFTPLLVRGPTQTINATAATSWTTEPTVLTVIKRWRFPWPGGPFVIQSPLGREINTLTTASTSGKFVGLRLTSSVAVTNSDSYLEIEE